MLDFSRLSFPPLCAVSNQGGTADQGCESPWDSGHAYHGGNTEQVSWKGMYSVTKSRKRRQFAKTTGFDEEIHSAQTFEHKNRFQAIAVRIEDCVDDATTNMNMAGQSKYVAKGKDRGSASVAVDSGACDNVINPKDLAAYEDQVMETEASANQVNFLAANGEEIDNNGEVKVPAVTRERTLRGITFQAAGVSKGLLSVEKMNENGHAVVFDGDMSFVVNKATGEVNHLRRQDGNFMLDLWILPPDVAETWGFGRQP